MSYFYNIAINFPSGVELGQLQTDIINESSISTSLLGIESNAFDITITFNASLSPLELVSLNNVISNYIFVGQPVLDPNGSLVPFIITNLIYRADTTAFQTISQLSWVNNRYRRFVNSTFIANFTIYDRNLEWILYDVTNAMSIGTGIVVSSGIYTYNITNPLNDTIIQLQIRKINSGGRSPEINNSVIEYNS